MILKQHQLQPYNTFHTKAVATHFSDISTVAQLHDLLKCTQAAALPKIILGRGSNILIARDIDALIIKNSISGINLIKKDAQHVFLKVGAGQLWHNFVLYCLKHNYAGIENLSLIPGTVGAAPIQNIGAYGVELESVFESLDAIELKTGAHRKFSKAECEFGYRSSIFKTTLKNQYIITHVTLKLSNTPNIKTAYGTIRDTLDKMGIQNPSIQDVSRAIIDIRIKKLPDPKKLPNAGSFFKNPILSANAFETLLLEYPDIPHYPQPDNTQKIPAAWLIDQCGLKGYQQNKVGVSPNHALVLINYGNDNGAQIVALAQHIKDHVAEKFKIQLDNEVTIL